MRVRETLPFPINQSCYIDLSIFAAALSASFLTTFPSDSALAESFCALERLSLQEASATISTDESEAHIYYQISVSKTVGKELFREARIFYQVSEDGEFSLLAPIQFSDAEDGKLVAEVVLRNNHPSVEIDVEYYHPESRCGSQVAITIPPYDKASI